MGDFANMMVARRLFAWRFSSNNAYTAQGVAEFEEPPTPTYEVGVMPGSQLHFSVYCAWQSVAVAARPLAWLFTPRFKTFWGPATPNPQIADRNEPIPVLQHNANTRLTTTGFVAGAADDMRTYPMKYRPRPIAASLPSEQRIVETELVYDRIRLWRDTTFLDVTIHRHAHQFYFPALGQEPVTDLRERALSFDISWEQTPDDDTNPFLEGDELMIVVREGTNAKGK